MTVCTKQSRGRDNNYLVFIGNLSKTYNKYCFFSYVSVMSFDVETFKLCSIFNV